MHRLAPFDRMTTVSKDRLISSCTIVAYSVLSFLIVGATFAAAQGTTGKIEPSQSTNEKKRVLLLGDSISIGYHATVKKELADVANVFRPMNKNGRGAENCAGTLKGVKEIDRWLKIDGGNFDLIHFNFGLHDLKRVDRTTGKNSMKPEDPRQSEPEAYEKQLREIVSKLKKTGAQLIFATTTPVPKGVRPMRDTTDPGKYNAIAIKIMKENDIAVNDLYTFADERLEKIQQKANVHFSKEGSAVLGKQVAKVIASSLQKANSK